MRRFKARWWNSGDPRLLTPKAFGVGWDINIGRLVRGHDSQVEPPRTVLAGAERASIRS